VNSVVAGSKDAVKTAAAGSKDDPSTKAIVIAGDPKRLPRPPVAKAAAKAAGSKRRRLKGGASTEKAGHNTLESLGSVLSTLACI
jgi:hypothetical protein